ncbi:hypothetical protein NIASO_06350 [Niabella soli DSM 19437]|uniref:Uncharacterized protein n=1 Tax=Niabella soli DSM 19437 TaxID=929713 RepID=W0F6E0_9BACT|nr:hypothetical protein NIASO_06350 [Niabella soli DSM 19437]
MIWGDAGKPGKRKAFLNRRKLYRLAFLLLIPKR